MLTAEFEQEAVSDVELLTATLERSFEEASLLRDIATRLNISRSTDELVCEYLERIHRLVNVEGIAIHLVESDREPRLQTIGSLPFDSPGLRRLLDHFATHDWRRPLVVNGADSGPLRDLLPGIRQLLVVALGDGLGQIIACNTTDGRELGTEEACVVTPIATILGVHVRNVGLFREQERMLVTFSESMIRTLDARDPYTRGHSERVALVARHLGRELGHDEDECENLHLSGLLHDIGKIGVPDHVLRKHERLTEAEFELVKRHPVVGYEILKGIARFAPALPGILHHHESWDGSGYPDGLAGEDIPPMARILAVADSFDAMWSTRPYRDGMPIERIEAILREGAGRQWDANAVAAFFAVEAEVLRSCQGHAAPEDREERPRPPHDSLSATASLLR